jgi:hypothetical protein
MAVFVANPSCKDADPAEEECLGTMIHVIGSPFGGFVLEIRRNWDCRRTRNIESVHGHQIRPGAQVFGISSERSQAKRHLGPDRPDRSPA